MCVCNLILGLIVALLTALIFVFLPHYPDLFLQLVIGWYLYFHQAMTLMEYLIKTGSERVAQQCRENIYAVQTLKDFQYIDRDGKDQVHKHTLGHKAV